MNAQNSKPLAVSLLLNRYKESLVINRSILLVLLIATACTNSEVRNAEAARNFLQQNRVKPGVAETQSGLQYRIDTPGHGCRPEPGSRVVVHYQTRVLGNPVPIDSSYARGEPGTYPLDKMIPAWTEGIPMMRTGAKWTLFVPPALAYGTRNQPRIGPSRLMIFDVELLEAQSCRRADL